MTENTAPPAQAAAAAAAPRPGADNAPAATEAAAAGAPTGVRRPCPCPKGVPEAAREEEKKEEEKKPPPVRRKSKGSKNGGFNPKPYTFRLQRPIQGPRAREPPFHVMLDHTIAVLWNLVKKRANPPGVDHLQWAKHFLKRIRNHRGDMPPDVKMVVDAIDDRMLNEYAKISGGKQWQDPSNCCMEDREKYCQAKQSITFSEMMKQEPELTQYLFCADTAPIPAPCKSHIACDCDTWKKDTAKYLKEQRAERVRIINAELKRLTEIEQHMGKLAGNGSKTNLRTPSRTDNRARDERPAPTQTQETREVPVEAPVDT